MTQSTNTAAVAAPSQEVSAARKQRNKLILHVAIILAATLAIWFAPTPEGVDPRGMHMLAIFVGTILGLILQPLPTPVRGAHRPGRCHDDRHHGGKR